MDVFGRSGITPGEFLRRGSATRSSVATSRVGGTKVVVTGDKALDAKLRSLPAAIQRKLIRGALRRCMKRVQREFKSIVENEAYDTGAYYGATKIRALRRSRSRFGVEMIIDVDKYIADYTAKHDGKPPHPAAGETKPFYVPAVIEFGDATHPPIRAQRRALYDHQDQCRADFIKDINEFLKESAASGSTPGASPTNSELRESAKAAGEVAYRDSAGRLQSVKGGFISFANAQALGYRGK